MIQKRSQNVTKPNDGFTIIELVVVVAVASILTAVAIPQMISQRRLTRSTALTREILTQLRHARQLAMSQQQAVTFQYDNVTKVIKIIDHNNDPEDVRSGTAVLVANGGQLSTALPAKVVSTVSLAQGGLSASEISYGIPTTSTGLPTGASAIPTGPLGDGISMTALYQDKFNVTFQADGSVINPAGIPQGPSPPAGIAVSQGIPMDQAMFIFNNKAAQGTAVALSVLGASGRIKVWRYNVNANKYEE